MTITRKTFLVLKKQRLILPKNYRLNQDLIEKSVLPLMSCKTTTNVHSENEVLDGYIADIDTEDEHSECIERTVKCNLPNHVKYFHMVFQDLFNKE